ncbi:hypothetical protein NFI96_025908, partial [Prochilodus magdalenae]
ECYNYIKVLVLRNDETLFICGTNAFNPTCRNYRLSSLEQVGTELVGQARCPFESHQVNVGIFAGGHFYSATMSDFQASDAVIYRSLGGEGSPVLRSIKYDSKWLREPRFLHVIEYSSYVYFFFSEVAVESTAFGKVVYSRVARVCKNDSGGSARVLERYWTSFLKARLNCSVPGDSFFYFDVLQSISSVIQINQRPAVVGVFTTQRNSIPGSAVCGFYMDEIERVFQGTFKEQKGADSTWTTVPGEQIPTPRPGSCAGDGSASAYSSSVLFPDSMLSFIKAHPLMEDCVSSINNQPFLTHTTRNCKLNQIVVDTVAGPYKNWTVFFLGSEDGHVLKVLISSNQNSAHTATLLEDIHVYNPSKCNGDRKVLGLELDKEHHALFVAFSSCIIRVPVSRCSQQYRNCRSPFILSCCLSSPYSLPPGLSNVSVDERSSHSVHYMLLVIFAFVAFVCGAFLSGLMVLCYCSQQSQHNEAHELQAKLSLIKLNSLLEPQPHRASEQIYSSFMSKTKKHGAAAVETGPSGGGPDQQQSSLSVPDSTPEPTIEQTKAFRSQRENLNHCCSLEKKVPTQQVFPFTQRITDNQSAFLSSSNNQSVSLSNIQPAAFSKNQSASLSNIQSASRSNIQSAPLSNIQSASRSNIQSASLSTNQSASLSTNQSASLSNIQSASLSNIQSASHSNIQSASRSNIPSASFSKKQSGSSSLSKNQSASPYLWINQSVSPSKNQSASLSNSQSASLSFSNNQSGASNLPNFQSASLSPFSNESCSLFISDFHLATSISSPSPVNFCEHVHQGKCENSDRRAAVTSVMLPGATGLSHCGVSVEVASYYSSSNQLQDHLLPVEQTRLVLQSKPVSEKEKDAETDKQGGEIKVECPVQFSPKCLSVIKLASGAAVSRQHSFNQQKALQQKLVHISPCQDNSTNGDNGEKCFGSPFDLSERAEGFDLSDRADGFDLSERAEGFDLSERAEGFDLSERADGFDLSGRSDGFDLSERADGFDLSERADGFDLSGRSDGFDLSERAEGFDLSGISDGFDLSERADGFDLSDRAEGFDLSDRAEGFNLSDRDEGFDLSDRAEGFDLSDRSNGFDLSDRADGFDLSDRAEGFDLSDRAEGFDLSDRADGFDLSDRAEGFDLSDRAEGFDLSERADGFDLSDRAEGFDLSDRAEGFDLSDRAEGFDLSERADGFDLSDRAEVFDLSERADGFDLRDRSNGFDLSDRADGFDLSDRADGFDLRERAEGFNLSDRAEGFDLSDRADGFDLSERANGFDLRDRSDGFDLSERADGFDLRERAEGFNLSDRAEGFDLSDRADGFDLSERANGFDLRDRSDGFDLSERADGFDL